MKPHHRSRPVPPPTSCKSGSGSSEVSPEKWNLLRDEEVRRLALQERLDAAKTTQARNRLGQFSTPTALARDIVRHGVQLLPTAEPIRFLDPAIGTGSFYSALLDVAGGSGGKPKRIASATGFEIDPHYGSPARELWSEHSLLTRLEDFTQAEPTEREKANLLICNPPYVRHHHIDAATKARLKSRAGHICGTRLSGLCGLYGYFLLLSHLWLRPGAVAGWLVPSEFMDVNYGRAIKHYLLNKVSLLQIHRFDPTHVQFADALVSSAVVWFRNEPPAPGCSAVFSYGGTFAAPNRIRHIPTADLETDLKWTRHPTSSPGPSRFRPDSRGPVIDDLFSIKRGIATGDNHFFVLPRAEIEKRHLPLECFVPVLPSARYLPADEIQAGADGLPLLDKQLFLLDIQIPESVIVTRYPKLKEYLDSGHCGSKPVTARYLCRHRKPWYSQEKRPPAPWLCTYMGRRRDSANPFRFILNHSRATACNVYLMIYPRPATSDVIQKNPSMKREIWSFLQQIQTEDLLHNGRVYGGGLYKLEPKELARVSLRHLVERHQCLQPPDLLGIEQG